MPVSLGLVQVLAALLLRLFFGATSLAMPVALVAIALPSSLSPRCWAYRRRSFACLAGPSNLDAVTSGQA